MPITEILVKLCLYKARQLRLVQQDNLEALSNSLAKEQQLVLSIPMQDNLDDFDRALYNTYRVLEQRLLDLLERKKKETAIRLAESQISRLLQRGDLS